MFNIKVLSRKIVASNFEKGDLDVNQNLQPPNNN